MTTSASIQYTHAKPQSGESHKTWAKQHLRGGEVFILPSHQADLKSLDEDGLRRDVRHSIAQGFCSVMPLNTGIDVDTYMHMNSVIADEAKNKILMVGVIRPGSWQKQKANIRALEHQGFSHALMYFNPELQSLDEIYQQMREIIENTSLAIVLYVRPNKKIERFDPAGLPLDVFDKLAELDNVVAVKFTQELRPAAAYAVAERVGDRLLLGVVDLEMMLPLSLKYKVQWAAQWGIDSLQSPEKPWVNQYLELLRLGKNEQAYDLYWQYEPIASAFYAMQAPSLRVGGHPWLQIKYMKWLTGGNGGLLSDLHESPEHIPHLTPQERATFRDNFINAGFKITDLPDEAFMVGTEAFKRGVRARDLVATPQYIV
ncbi:dihydrodipicolinate synthase family protein [Aurantivibrio plasticivorans]